MKKTIIAVALISGLAVVTTASANWGRGGGNAYNCPCQVGYQQQVDPASQEKYSQFFTETQELRKQLTMKQAERRALMQTENPDPAAASQLAGEIFDLRNSLQDKAQAAGISQFYGRGQAGFMGGGPRGGRGGGPRGGGQMMGGPRF